MISLLILVVLLTIATNLLSTIGAPAINALLWNIYNTFLPASSPAISKAAEARKEVLRLKKELAGTSSQDEFARWAKVRRTLDKKAAELETLNATVQAQRSAFETRASTARWVLTTGLRLFLQLWFSRRPMFWIPEGWVPGVVEWGFAFPRAPRGSVSIQVWSFAVGQVMAVVFTVGSWAWAQAMLTRRKLAAPTAAAAAVGEKVM